MTKFPFTRFLDPFMAWSFVLVALPACGPEKTEATMSDPGGIVRCVSRWSGPLEHDGPKLRVLACLNAANCTDEIEIVLDWGVEQAPPTSSCGPSGAPDERHCRETDPNVRGVATEYENFIFATSVLRSSDASTPTLMEFAAYHEYSPTFAATLSNHDRATLTVRSDQGDVLVDSTSEVPYEETPINELESCRGLQLDLSGMPLPSETGEP